MFIHPDDDGFAYSTESEWDNAAAYEIGSAHPERAWICTDRDVWHKNPFYQGPPVRHPEDDDHGEPEFIHEPMIDEFVDDIPF